MSGWFERLLFDSQFLTRFPHYAGILSNMVPVATNTIPIMAVSLKRLHDAKSGWRLLVNTDYFEQHPEHFAGVLCHEINHAVLDHLTNPVFHQVKEPKLMELAMEMAANEGIDEPLPEGVFLEQFVQYGIEPKQSTTERYQLLLTAHENGDLSLEDCWSPQMHDSHRPSRKSRLGSGLGDALDSKSDGATERNWDRRGNEFGKGYPAQLAEIEEMRRRISEFLGGEKGGEDDPVANDELPQPKTLQRIVLEGDVYRPEINWPFALGRFLQQREVTPSYLRPNRRFPDRVGELPGRKRHFPKPSILAAVDTSGSMTGEMLDRIRIEIDQLARHARLTIAECDATVHRLYPYKGSIDVFVGGGDTLFSPVFDEFKINQYLGIIYFTDGKGETASLPDSIATLWAILKRESIEIVTKKPSLERGPATTQ